MAAPFYDAFLAIENKIAINNMFQKSNLLIVQSAKFRQSLFHFVVISYCLIVVVWMNFEENYGIADNGFLF
jgi:hypothetical protein